MNIKDEDFYCGVLVALGCVYSCGAEGAAEEIVQTCGATKLLQVAKKNEDLYLPNLRHTISFLRGQHKRMKHRVALDAAREERDA